MSLGPTILADVVCVFFQGKIKRRQPPTIRNWKTRIPQCSWLGRRPHAAHWKSSFPFLWTCVTIQGGCLCGLKPRPSEKRNLVGDHSQINAQHKHRCGYVVHLWALAKCDDGLAWKSYSADAVSSWQFRCTAKHKRSRVATSLTLSFTSVLLYVGMKYEFRDMRLLGLKALWPRRSRQREVAWVGGALAARWAGWASCVFSIKCSFRVWATWERWANDRS